MVGYGPHFDDQHRRHFHDDNCRKMTIECAKGHNWDISERRTCNQAGCDWKGIETCGCPPGKKVDKFPDLPLLGSMPKG